LGGKYYLILLPLLNRQARIRSAFMKTQKPLNPSERTITIVYDSERSKLLFIDISGIITILYNCFNTESTISKKAEIEKLLSIIDWKELYWNRKTNRRYYANILV
jgi:hypothetical protein